MASVDALTPRAASAAVTARRISSKPVIRSVAKASRSITRTCATVYRSRLGEDVDIRGL